MHSASMYPGDLLDKNSVVACLKTMHNWIIFDPDMQINLPVVPGSTSARMWPHSAIINTRSKSSNGINEKKLQKAKGHK